MPNEVAVIDPLGKTIHLLPGIFFAENEIEEIYDEVATVIKKPALLVKEEESNVTQFYYFRSIGWKRTLLIVARWEHHQWEAYSCMQNPSIEILSAILKKGIQLI